MAAPLTAEDVVAMHDAGCCGPGCCDFCDAADAARSPRCPVCWSRTIEDVCAACGSVVDPQLPLEVCR